MAGVGDSVAKEEGSSMHTWSRVMAMAAVVVAPLAGGGGGTRDAIMATMAAH